MAGILGQLRFYVPGGQNGSSQINYLTVVFICERWCGGGMEVALRVLIIALIVFPAKANEKCDSLAPTISQDVTEEFKGRAEGKIEGVLSRLAGGAASLDGEYRKLVTDELKNYPKADKLYVWQRIIYLACIRPEVNIDFNKLFELYIHGPDQIPRPNSAVTSRLPAAQTGPSGFSVRGSRNIINSIDGSSGVTINNTMNR